MSLTEKLAEYRAGWYQRVPADRQAIIERHIDELRRGAIARTMLKVGDRARPSCCATPRRKASTSTRFSREGRSLSPSTAAAGVLTAISR